jgi:hypothetical protein
MRKLGGERDKLSAAAAKLFRKWWSTGVCRAASTCRIPRKTLWHRPKAVPASPHQTAIKLRSSERMSSSSDRPSKMDVNLIAVCARSRCTAGNFQNAAHRGQVVPSGIQAPEWTICSAVSAARMMTLPCNAGLMAEPNPSQFSRGSALVL